MTHDETLHPTMSVRGRPKMDHSRIAMVSCARMSAGLAGLVLAGALSWMTLGWSDSGGRTALAGSDQNDLAAPRGPTAEGGLSLPSFNLLPGGVLEWPGKL